MKTLRVSIFPIGLFYLVGKIINEDICLTKELYIHII